MEWNERIGWKCYHITGIEGFPDVLMLKGDLGRTCELKIFYSQDKNKSIKSLFQTTQMPFYIRQVEKSPIYIFFKNIDSGIIYWTCFNQINSVISFFSKKIKYLLGLPVYIMGQEDVS